MNRRTFLGRMLAAPVALAGVVWGVKAGGGETTLERSGVTTTITMPSGPLWVTLNVTRRGTTERHSFIFPAGQQFVLPFDCVADGATIGAEFNA